MSVYSTCTQAFIELFSEQELNDFYQQIRHLQDDEAIVDAIDVW